MRTFYIDKSEATGGLHDAGEALFDHGKQAENGHGEEDDQHGTSNSAKSKIKERTRSLHTTTIPYLRM